MNNDNKKIVTVGIFVLIAVAIIAYGIYAGLSGSTAPANNPSDTANQAQLSSDEFSVPLPNDNDPIVGNKDAKVVLLEYSDIECPYCQKFHATLNTTQPQFKADEFAWAFRHFPLPMHQHARLYATASICAQKSTGNKGFWDYLNALIPQIEGGDAFSEAKLISLAESQGIDRTAFSNCLNDKNHESIINQSTADAQKAGGNGTPFNVFYMKDGISAETESMIKQGLGENVRISKDKKFLALAGAPSDEGFVALVKLLLGKK